MIEIENNERTDYENSLLRTDVLITDSFLTVAKNLQYGRLSDIARVSDDSLQISLLQQTLNGQRLKTNLESQEPKFSGYCALKEALKIFLDILKDKDRSIFFREQDK